MKINVYMIIELNKNKDNVKFVLKRKFEKNNLYNNTTMANIENKEVIMNAINEMKFNEKFNEIKLKLDIEEIDVSENKAYTITVEDLFSKYDKSLYNLKGNKAIRSLCSEITEVLGQNEKLKDYKRFYKVDKVGFFNKVDKNNKIYKKLNLTIKMSHNYSTISVEFMLIN